MSGDFDFTTLPVGAEIHLLDSNTHVTVTEVVPGKYVAAGNDHGEWLWTPSGKYAGPRTDARFDGTGRPIARHGYRYAGLDPETVVLPRPAKRTGRSGVFEEWQ